MGCVFSKPQELGHGVQRKVLLVQHSLFINNNPPGPRPRPGLRPVERRPWEEVTEMVTLRQRCPRDVSYLDISNSRYYLIICFMPGVCLPAAV